MEGLSEAIAGLSCGLPFAETRFLVVGGNGYFGYKLVEALVGRGAALVRVLDRAQTHFLGCAEVDFVVGDVTDYGAVARAVEGVDVVFHTASFFGDPAFGSFGDGASEWAVNVEGTRNVLRAAREAAVGRKIAAAAAGGGGGGGAGVPSGSGADLVRVIYYGSSSAVFNGSTPLVDAPDDTPYPPYHVDHYGRCKAVAEQEVRLLHDPRGSGLATCVLRPNGIYGEHEIIHIPRVVRVSRPLLRCLPVYFDRGHLSDWTFVDNLIFASFLAAERLARPDSVVGGRVYNITDGDPLGYIDFFKPMVEACGIAVVPLLYVPFFLLYPFAFLFELVCHLLRPLVRLRPPLTRMEAIKMGITHYFSIKNARADLGYYPLVPRAVGLRRTADWFRLNDPTLPKQRSKEA